MSKIKGKKIFLVILFFFGMGFFSGARAETLKIGFVTDWEYGTKKEYDHKLPRKAPKYLKRAVNHFNKSFKPDYVIGGGDYILSRGVSKKKAAKQLRYINNIFRKSIAPRLYCIGNHDVSDLSKEEVQQNLGIDYLHSITDINGMRIITMDTNYKSANAKGFGVTGIVSDEELEWLESALNTELPAVVFSHHSPVQTVDGNILRTNIYSADRVRGVLEKNGNVVAVFSGHHAVNYSAEVNGINYVIINNLTDKKAKGSFANITVEKTGKFVSVNATKFGKRQVTYNFSKTLTTNLQ